MKMVQDLDLKWAKSTVYGVKSHYVHKEKKALTWVPDISPVFCDQSVLKVVLEFPFFLWPLHSMKYTDQLAIDR